MTTQDTVHRDAETEWMARAISLATINVSKGGGPFGALVVRDDDVVATGSNQVTSTLDPTAHAEITAMRRACRALASFALEGCALVTSCEPCPMCLSSALWARVDRIVYAANRDDAARGGFDDRRFYDLFDKKPASMWPTSVYQLDVPNRTEPFEAWLGKTDRVEY